MSTKLTERRLRALAFAMSHLLAGDVEATLEAATDIQEADLHAADDWVYEELCRRRAARLARAFDTAAVVPRSPTGARR